MRSSAVFLAFLALVATSCTINIPQQQQPTPKTQLQTREFQRREFDTNDTKLIMKAALNVLQDDNFIVKNAVMDLGLLVAVKEIDLTRTGTATSSSGGNETFWQAFFRALADDSQNNRNRNNNNQQPRFSKFKQIEATINVSELGKRSTVRANFQVRVLDNNGNPLEVYTVDDQRFYQEFFMKMDKGIFLQKEGL